MSEELFRIPPPGSAAISRAVSPGEPPEGIYIVALPDGLRIEIDGGLMARFGLSPEMRLRLELAEDGYIRFCRAEPWEAGAEIHMENALGVVFLDVETVRAGLHRSGQQYQLEICGLQEMLTYRDRLSSLIQVGKLNKATCGLKELDAAIEKEQIVEDFRFFLETVQAHSTDTGDGGLVGTLKIMDSTEEMETLRRVILTLYSHIIKPGGENRVRRLINKSVTQPWSKRWWATTFASIRKVTRGITDMSKEGPDDAQT